MQDCSDPPIQGQLASVVEAWKLLCEHHALNWTPPMWRRELGGGDQRRAARHAVRAVERNLLVQVECDEQGRSVVRLSTGPLRDRELGDGIDPVAPAAERDRRLDVEGPTFEVALCALAARVVEFYGPARSERNGRPTCRPLIKDMD